MKNIKLLIISIVYICIFSCTDREEDLKERQRNPNIVALEQGGANAVWLTDSAICVTPLSVNTLDKNFNIIQTKQLGSDGVCCSYNALKNTMLYITNSYIDKGSLHEYDFNTNHVDVILSDRTIVGARYYKDDKIIYCTRYFDNVTELRIDLYMYNRTTKGSSFIRSINYYSSFSNPNNVNGFDVHPQENKLLFHEDGFIVEYDIDSKQLEKVYALPYNSNWFRYNPTGNKIMYKSTNGIEVLDLTTKKSKILNTNTAIYEIDRSIDEYPCWSPNGKNIIYGSSHLEYIDDGGGPYKLYILKNVD